MFFQGVILNKIYITEDIKNYKKGLRQKVLSERKNNLFFNEPIVGIDGKEHYFKKVRINMYEEIIGRINKQGRFDTYLGMEPDYVWKQVF